ncbi:hypothetical protein RvY_10594 [Ramazzottius varieornatus]|uniref:C2 domain-containing protein n=1 Tax=Ramazzottius varieornatus TaxID=947166 RepID=A0A1D1VDA9_RAMVA|nr:hypothetical protein RvY_10594 [Ramazzottius varieornatus]
MDSVLKFALLTIIFDSARAQLIPFSVFSTNNNNQSSPLQIEVLLLRFDNPNGIVYSGKKCDFFAWGCDISAFGYIDVTRPYDEWPGERDMRGSDHFWYKSEESSPRFNRMFTLTLCDPKAFSAGNLRVHMMDIDGGLRGADDFINNFNCIFSKPGVISSNEQSAPWSREMTCDAMYLQPMMSMYFKYRMFYQPNSWACK